jgi:ATP diphosphatase
MRVVRISGQEWFIDMKKQQTNSNINQLLEIMQRLRDPDNGCPWDIEQDFVTIAPYTIEEAYEVSDAITRNNMDDLRDELGDLLFQTVFHAQMADELGEFNFSDVVQSVCDKMTRRHPHVFADTKIKDSVAQTEAWEKQKASERRNRGSQGVLSDIPIALPATMRALKLQQRAARVGFDWPDVKPIFDKLQEEIIELQNELKAEDNHANIENEMGDILFVCINLARKLNVSPEMALTRTNKKFTTRFKHIEVALKSKGKTPETSNLQEMEQLWRQAKSKE